MNVVSILGIFGIVDILKDNMQRVQKVSADKMSFSQHTLPVAYNAMTKLNEFPKFNCKLLKVS